MTRPDVRSLAADLPRLLATLPADAGEVVRVEIDDRGFPGAPEVLVETERNILDHDHAELVRTEIAERMTWKRYVVKGQPVLVLRQAAERRSGSSQVLFVREDSAATAPHPTGGIKILD